MNSSAPGAHDIQPAERPGVVHTIVAVALGVLAAASAGARVYESAQVRGSSMALALAIAGAGALALVVARVRGNPISCGWVAAALAAIGVTVCGLPELPAYASIDSFGRSPYFAYVNLVVLGVALGAAIGATRRGQGDDMLLVFTAFTAFGGPMFVRDAQEYHGHFLLLCAILLLCAPTRSGQRLRDIPFLGLCAAFLAWSLWCTRSAVDVDRHLQGVARAACAFVPLLVLGVGSTDLNRARTMLWAFAGMILAGTACSAITVLEAGQAFSLPHALNARLQLFGAHPNIIAPFFSVAPPLLLALLVAAKRLPARIVLLAALAGALWALKLTQSRAALLGGGLSIAAFVALAACVAVWRRRPRASTVAGLLAVALIVGASGAYAVRHKIAAKLEDPSMTFRVEMWKTAVDALREHPVEGYGFLTGSPLMSHAKSSELDGRSKDTHPHMLVLAIGLGTGWPGIALFLGLIAAFLVRTSIAGARLMRVEDRALAIGAVASALALIAANTIDQGLALNTPLPLHFGILLGCGALCVRAARHERLADSDAIQAPAAAATPSVPYGAVVGLLAVLIAFVAGRGLIAARFSELAQAALRNRDTDDAVRWYARARAVNPSSLAVAMDYAETLDQATRREEAIASLWHTTTTHPLAWQPWDRISTIEADRHEEMLALQAVKNAQRRDPTGPIAAEWALRCARLQIQLRQRESAITELASALRFDFHAAERVPWRVDPSNGELSWVCPPPLEPITLRSIQERNRDLMRAWTTTDPVRARRVANTVARIFIDFKMYDDARAVIAEFESTNAPWLGIQFLKIELDAIANQDAAAAASAAASASTVASPSDESFSGVEGQTGLFYAEARRQVAAGDHRGAIAAAERGVAVVYDMVSESEYLRLLIDIAFESACALEDATLARRWFSPSLYFNIQPQVRVDRHVRLAQCLTDAKDADGALQALKSAAPYFARLQPTPETVASVLRAGHALGKLAQPTDADAATHARAWLAGLGDSPAELLIAGIAHTDLRDAVAARVKFQRLRATDAVWFSESVKRGN